MGKRQKEAGRKNRGRIGAKKKGCIDCENQMYRFEVCKNQEVVGHDTETCCLIPDRFKQENCEVETGLVCIVRHCLKYN